MEVYDLIKTSPYFANIPPAKLATLAKNSTLRTATANELVARAGLPVPGIIYLAEGRLAIFRRNVSHDITILLGRMSAPSIFGDMEVLADMPWTVSARAETDCVYVVIPAQVFHSTIINEPDVLYRLYRDTSTRHLMANHSARVLALHSVETRLLRLLIDYVHSCGHVENERGSIDYPLSQVDLAVGLGVNRRTIARTLEPLLESGLIERSANGKSFVLARFQEAVNKVPADLFGLMSQFDMKAQPISAKWLESGNGSANSDFESPLVGTK